MYSTCLFCNNALGANEVVESFPVGRRLAFDQRLGRLWVVCRKCEKWNLTPLEERWEAIETCERLFRDTRKRVSTENIGLARLTEGLELVRIGEPHRPEFAAWRYGDQFGRRRRRTVITGAGLSALATGVAIMQFMPSMAGSGLLLAGTSAQLVLQWTMARSTLRRRKQVFARVTLPDGTPLPLSGLNFYRVQEDFSNPTGWSLLVKRETKTLGVVDGERALPAIAGIMASYNLEGGKPREVTAAVDTLEDAGDINRLMRSIIREHTQTGGKQFWRRSFQPGLHYLNTEVRLALEMAANEDRERRALEGELALLELAWKDAEEIATIADRLTLPPAVETRLAALKKKN